MSVSPGKARLLGRAREEAEKAPPAERVRALVAVAQGGDPEDLERARAASEGSDALRASLVGALAKRGHIEPALSLLGTIREPGPRGAAAYAASLGLATWRAKATEEIPADG